MTLHPSVSSLSLAETLRSAGLTIGLPRVVMPNLEVR
jgi:hypothetical protein